MLSFIQQIKKIHRLHARDFAYSRLHFEQEGRKWSPTFINPLPPVSTFLHTRTQTNQCCVVTRIKIISK